MRVGDGHGQDADDTWAPRNRSNLAMGYAWWLWPVHAAVGVGALVLGIAAAVRGDLASAIFLPAVGVVFATVAAFELRDARARNRR